MPRKSRFYILQYHRENGTHFNAFCSRSAAAHALNDAKLTAENSGKPPTQAARNRPARNTIQSDRSHRRGDALPPSCPPRGLSRAAAAAYIGVSVGLFDELVRDGRMPGPKRINSRVVWDRHAVDAAFTALADDNEEEGYIPWDHRYD